MSNLITADNCETDTLLRAPAPQAGRNPRFHRRPDIL